ncbi:MAG: hypothetical protein Q9164_004158 [Protoblastenia rupestris]
MGPVQIQREGAIEGGQSRGLEGALLQQGTYHGRNSQIFRHHISLIEGHLKMIDMVRKHTVEGTGNWDMICKAIDRAREMLSTSKHVARTFLPPPRQREQVPLGSSSASMYPGYSPADHEYGVAAEEFGRYATEARQKGEKIELPGVEYEVGQAKGIKRKSLAGMKEALAKKKEKEGSGSGSGSGSDAPVIKHAHEKTTTNGEATETNLAGATSEALGEDDNPYFVVDTKPMKVDLPGIPAPKRSATPSGSTEIKESKRVKKSHEGELPAGEGFEDISAEVDAKLKEKEEKRKHKEEKKRKRETGGAHESAVASMARASGETDSPMNRKKKKHKDSTEDAKAEMGIALDDGDDVGAEVVQKPKKKKPKHSNDEGLSDRRATKKRAGEEDGEIEDGEGKKKKKRKKDDGSEV